MNQSFVGAGPTTRQVLDCLGVELRPAVARAVFRNALSRARLSTREFERRGLDREFIHLLIRSLRIHTRDLDVRRRCQRRLEQLEVRDRGPALEETTFELTHEDEIVSARSEARTCAASLGFDPTSCVKIATVVSELGRNMFRYAGGGRINIRPFVVPKRGIHIVAEDDGPGIPNLELIMSGSYQSKTGMGLGLLACKRLMDEFEIETNSTGTRISTRKYLRR